MLKLGQNALKIGSGATPRGGKSAYLEEGPYALVRSQNVYNHGFQSEGLAYISEDQATKLTNVALMENDVLINITGDSVARVCLLDPSVLPARVNQHVAILRPDPSVIDPLYLRYFLVKPSSQSLLHALASAGATRNALTKSMLESLEVPDLGIDLQRSIGRFLKSLDDKIEVNRRMNETLEEMARALFRDWFVDFGPTRRQMDGATDPAAIMGHAFPPEKAAELAPLFPAKLSDHGLPEGWTKQKIEHALARLKVGKLYNQKTALKVGEVPILDQGKFGVIGYHNNEPNIVASADDRVGIFANHTCVQRLLDHPFSTIQNVIPYRGKELPTEWCHYATLGQQNFEEYKGHWPIFVSKEIIKPNPEPTIAFAEIVDAMLMKVSASEQENQTLAEMRDLLLPKLMSGEIRLKDAEAVL